MIKWRCYGYVYFLFFDLYWNAKLNFVAESRILQHLSQQPQGHAHQELRSYIMQYLCAEPSPESSTEMSRVHEVIWRQRFVAGTSSLIVGLMYSLSGFDIFWL